MHAPTLDGAKSQKHSSWTCGGRYLQMWIGLHTITWGIYFEHYAVLEYSARLRKDLKMHNICSSLS
jgi:hypothetical protein